MPQTIIRSFNQLIAQISETSKLGFLYELLENFNPDNCELEKFLNFSDFQYQRNLVHRCELFELLVLCWKQGQASPVHNHRNSWCGVKVLYGTATEINFQSTPSGTWIPINRTNACKNNIICSYDTETHLLGNFHQENLISVHLNYPPLKNFDVIPFSQTLAAPLHYSYGSVGPEITINQL